MTTATQDSLAQRVAYFARSGWRVESQSDQMAVVVKGKRPNHVLHLILTIVTAGLWGLFVWLPLSLMKHEQRMVLTVGEDGSVTGATG